jgi:catalase
MNNTDNDSSAFELDRELGESYYKSKELEQRLTEDTIDVIKEFIDRRFKQGRRPALRDAHAEATGCVSAEFCVEEGLSDQLSRGIFKEGGRKYKAWIRFSNANSELQNARWPDPRGMAIKLLDVEGKRLLGDDAHTQDFILVNRPVFFGDDLEKYVDALRQYLSGGTLAQYWSISKLNWREKIVALRVNLNLITNPLFAQYWSMTPYALGSEPGKRIAVKYTAKPTAPNPENVIRRTATFLSPNFSLKSEVDKVLYTNGVSFDFCVQSSLDSTRTPIEDCKKEWSERDTPPLKVARICIPPQSAASTVQNEFFENLSFNPWHGLEAHRPLGSVNRVRKTVYLEISKYRHRLNSVDVREP